MIAPQEIRSLADRAPSERPVVSLFLDVSVNAENRRTHHVFLNKQRARFAELDSDRARQHLEPMGAFLSRVETWLETDFDEANRGVALYAELGDDWFHAVQLPVPVANRLEMADRPLLEPLAQAFSGHPRFAVALVDREHLRLLAVRMGRLIAEGAWSPDAVPVPHDVQAGGMSQKDIQKRKAEETRQFYRDFAERMAEFDRRQRPQHWILAGTTENVQNFREFVSPPLAARVAATTHAPFDVPAAEIVQRLAGTFEEVTARASAEAVEQARDRLRTGHRAVGGMREVLEVLQEGKVAGLVVSAEAQREGSECGRCGFLLTRTTGPCPYCGGDVRDGVDLVEAILRIAVRREVPVEFVDDGALHEASGVGALLAF